MNWETLKARFKRRAQPTSVSFILPSVVVEIEPGFVAAARLDASSRQVRSIGVRELEAGWLEPLPSRPNIANLGAVQRAASEVATRVSNGRSHLGLLLPDASTHVEILRFEALPDDKVEAEALVRWRMREILPYGSAEARVSYQVLARDERAVEMLAVAVRESVLAEYGAALESLNGGPVLVLPATVALLPLLPEDPAVSHLLVHICSGSITTVVVTGDRIRFWRNRPPHGLPPPEHTEEIVRETGRVLATCHDHLNIAIANVWICARPPVTPDLNAELTRALGQQVSPLQEQAGGAATLPPPEQDLFRRFGMTFAGLVANLDQKR